MPTPIANLTLNDAERTPCEVWSRVMGYHRPTNFFNAGKKAEHDERLYFQEHPRPRDLGLRQAA